MSRASEFIMILDKIFGWDKKISIIYSLILFYLNGVFTFQHVTLKMKKYV